MALARLSVGVGKKGKAAPHALYIAREENYMKDNDDLEKMEAKAHGNMPKWAEKEPNYFWKMSDEHERKNGTSYREHVIALPRELSIEQRHELVKNWIEQEIGDKHAYQYAIHNPPALDGKDQPHVHLMFSERLIDGIERDPKQYFMRYNSKHPERGGAKKANIPKFSADRKEELKAMRERWEQMCNQHLEQANSAARINMKSYKDQNISYKPSNIPMKQFNKKHIKEAYVATLDAKAAWIQIARERKEIDITAELKRLTQLSAAERAMNTANVLFGNSMKLPEPKPQQSDLLQKDEAGRFASTPESTQINEQQRIDAELDRATDIYAKATETGIGEYKVYYPDVRNQFTERQLEILENNDDLYGWTGRRLKEELAEPQNAAIVALLLDPISEQAKYDKEHSVEQAQAAQKQAKDITAPNATTAAETKPSASVMRRRP